VNRCWRVGHTQQSVRELLGLSRLRGRHCFSRPVQ
jgi:ribosomal protein S14